MYVDKVCKSFSDLGPPPSVLCLMLVGVCGDNNSIDTTDKARGMESGKYSSSVNITGLR